MVLSRHRDESIIIGDDIIVTVIDIRGDKVRLGIYAPIEIAVDRTEVRDKINAAAPRAVACPCGKLRPAAVPRCERCGRGGA